MVKVKDLVKNKHVEFIFYRQGYLYYKVLGTDFEFPVPINDAGTATFLKVDKAIFFMRYIRKHLQTLEASSEI